MKIYTLEEIYLHHARNLMLHYPSMMIVDAVNEGYTVREMVDFLRAKGYTEGYLEEELDRLRKLQMIAPWEPD